MLRRRRRRRDQMSLPVVDQPVEQELCGARHQRQGARAQVLQIAAERVVRPEMLREPRAAHRPERPDRVPFAEVADGRGLPPEIRVVVDGPTLRAVVGPGGLRAADGHLADEVEQRAVHVGEVGGLRRPVVHLGVDVRRVVRAPRRTHHVVPDALKVRGLRAGAAARGEQVPAVREEQRDQLRIARARLRDPLDGRRRGRRRRRAEIERDARRDRGVIRFVRSAEALPRVARRGVERAEDDRRRVAIPSRA